MKTDRSHKASEVRVGHLLLGGNHELLIQSMCNTSSMDTLATTEQICRMADAGCDIVRLTTQGVKEAENLWNIKDLLEKRGYQIPLVADVHFNPRAAETAAAIVEKVRINPGNYVDRNRGKAIYTDEEYAAEVDRIGERLNPLLDICKKHKTAIRVGTNHGSLSDRILARYGNTPRGMVVSAMEFIHICRKADFHALVLSMKASDVNQMVAANHLLVRQMLEEGFYYPIHLGVTEAGDGEDARIKSAAGIGSLLAEGIGDTLRVSLTEEPEAEIPVADQLRKLYGKHQSRDLSFNNETFYLENDQKLALKDPIVVSTEPSDMADYDQTHMVENPGQKKVCKLSYPGIDKDALLIRATVDYKLLAAEQNLGIWIDNYNRQSANELASISLYILQALGKRISKPEYIACPSCGRTQFNIMKQLQKVRSETAHLRGLRIAVMGCIVNGPGEMAGADYGYVGAGPGKVSLYKGHQLVQKNIEESEALNALLQLIKMNGDWQDEGEPPS